MAVCVEIDLSGNLVQSAFPITSCPGFALLDASEYTGGLVLADLFAIPPSAELSSAWAAGFTLPLVVYLLAWALGVVVNFINTR